MTSTTLYTVTEAANILGIHPNTLRKWHNEGIAHALVLPGGHRRFKQEEIERLAKLMDTPKEQEAQP